MTKGTLNKWLKKEGDKVKKGEAVAEISSEKITNIVECPADGIIGKIVVKEGEVVPVATPIGIICLKEKNWRKFQFQMKKRHL